MKKTIAAILFLMGTQAWAQTATPVKTQTPVSLTPTATTVVMPSDSAQMAAPKVTASSTPDTSLNSGMPKVPGFMASTPTTDTTAAGEHFVFQLDGGLDVPISGAAATVFGSGFSLDARISYAFDDFFSMGLETGFSDLAVNVANTTLPTGSTSNMSHVPVLGVFQIGMGDQGGSVQPYLILAAGFAFDAYNLQSAAFKPGTTTSWTNFEFDPGLGIGFPLSRSMNLFVQGKFAMDFGPNSGSAAQSADTPILTIPVQVGLNFNL